jgi:PcRGLX-like N-terminal RIFT barrel domain/PcRGLX-like protein central beta sandwich domain
MSYVNFRGFWAVCVCLAIGFSASALTAETPGLPVLLTVQDHARVERKSGHVSSGLPFAPGKLLSSESVKLSDSSGKVMPLQTRILARWPDGSVKWLLLDFKASIPAGQKSIYKLEKGKSPAVSGRIKVTETEKSLLINTGPMQVALNRQGFELFSSVKVKGREILASKNRPGLAVTDLKDQKRDSLTNLAKGFKLKVMESGALRTVVRAQGQIQASKDNFLGFTAWYYFYAGDSRVRLFFTIRNLSGSTITATDQRSTADGKFQKVLSEKTGNVTVKAVDLLIPSFAKKDDKTIIIGGDKPHLGDLSKGGLKLYQDSSASWPWQAGDKAIFDPRLKANQKYMAQHGAEGRKHLPYYEFLDIHYKSLRNKELYVGCTFRGYKVYGADGAETARGERAPGWYQLGGNTVAVRWFWQLYPKTLDVSKDGSVRLGLWPREWSELSRNHTFAGHIHKTHELLFSFDGASGVPAAEAVYKRFNQRLLATAPPAYYCASGAFNGLLMPEDRATLKDPGYVKWEDWALSAVSSKVNSNCNPSYDSSIEIEREKDDHYGVWHFGDTGKRQWRGFGQYLELDIPYCLAAHYVRTGNRKFFEVLEELERQRQDVPAHGGGYGHQKGESSHYYTSGALLYYYLTGYQFIRQSIKVSHDAFARVAPWHPRSFTITMWSNLDMYREFGEKEGSLDQPWNYPAGPWKRANYLENIKKDLLWLNKKQNPVTGTLPGANNIFMLGLCMDALGRYCQEFPKDSSWRDRCIAGVSAAMVDQDFSKHTLTSPNGFAYGYIFTGKERYLDHGIKLFDSKMRLEDKNWPRYRTGTGSGKHWSEFGHRVTQTLMWARWHRAKYGTPKRPPAITDLSAKKVGDKFELSWTVPDFGKDKPDAYIIKLSCLPMGDVLKKGDSSVLHWGMAPRVQEKAPAIGQPGQKQTITVSVSAVPKAYSQGRNRWKASGLYAVVLTKRQAGPITLVSDLSNLVKMDQ